MNQDTHDSICIKQKSQVNLFMILEDKISNNDRREHKEGWDFYLCYVLICVPLA